MGAAITAATTTAVPVGAAVEAGPDQTITLPTNQVTLNGRINGVTARWVTRAGAAQSTVASPASAVTTVTFARAGTYKFELQSINARGRIVGRDSVKVFVQKAPPATPGGPTAIGSWRERIVNSDGTINAAQYEYVAKNYNKEEILNYRLGPSAVDAGARAEIQTVYQPDPNGLWKGGLNKALADKFCQTSDKLIQNDNPGGYGDGFQGGGGWQMSGQMLFAPDASAPADFRAGVSNMVAFDGAMATRSSDGTTQALCMRMGARWYGDWWLRNNMAAPTTPSVGRQITRNPNLPLPAVATTRGFAQASVTGFTAFQNGLIVAAGTGNDAYDGAGNGTAVSPVLQLPEGKVPTALALTAMNEFLFATIWDVKTQKGQLAVIAVGPADPSNIGNADAKRHGWGTQSWPEIRGLKLLGFVDLPMAAPNSLSVSLNTGTGKFRGHDTWRGPELLTQAGRDAWYRRSNLPLVNGLGDDQYWKLLATAGYAMVGSRAENKVAFVDLRPLLTAYRDQYFTTQAKWDETANSNQGNADNQWPYTFAFRPSQMPRVLGTLDITQPTAVFAKHRNSAPGRAYFVESARNWGGADRYAWIGAMDGTLRRYNITSLLDPSLTPVMPTTPDKVVKSGMNPVQIVSTMPNTSPTDDLFVVSRATRTIFTYTFDGTPLTPLKDSRLVDPVFLTIGGNGVGFGGSGKDRALGARALTILDYNGKTVHVYGMLADDTAKLYEGDKYKPELDEQWPYIGPDGRTVQPYQYGSGNRVAGKPFMYSIDEVI
ncbi:MAG: hypothetical protein C0476_09675 [Sphingomonas sp.]|nr:hypothetical protein [Sphingomonas sp.]